MLQRVITVGEERRTVTISDFFFSVLMLCNSGKNLFQKKILPTFSGIKCFIYETVGRGQTVW
jgi:hypothetical protein